MGRSAPSFLMRDRRALTFIPSTRAAPLGAADTSIASLADSPDVVSFHVGERAELRRPIVGLERPLPGGGAQPIFEYQRLSHRGDPSSCDDVCQVANVARPGVQGQSMQRVRRDTVDPLANAPAELFEEGGNQSGDVVSPIPQRRERDRKDAVSLGRDLRETGPLPRRASGLGSWPQRFARRSDGFPRRRHARIRRCAGL